MRTKGRVVQNYTPFRGIRLVGARRDPLPFYGEDLPERDDPKNLSEIGSFARSRGFNYDMTVCAAARGDTKALKRFFAISKEVDGAATIRNLNTEIRNKFESPNDVMNKTGEFRFEFSSSSNIRSLFRLRTSNFVLRISSFCRATAPVAEPK
jgi:hypothetical protein